MMDRVLLQVVEVSTEAVSHWVRSWEVSQAVSVLSVIHLGGIKPLVVRDVQLLVHTEYRRNTIHNRKGT